MKDIQLTEVVQNAYDAAKKAFHLGKLPINDVNELYHVAHTYAFFDIHRSNKLPDKKRHYDEPVDKLHKLFDSGKISESNSYASFAYCYLKVFEIEKCIKNKTFHAQFKYENKKHEHAGRGLQPRS